MVEPQTALPPAVGSEADLVLSDALEAAGLPSLIRHFPVTFAGHGSVRLDLAIPAARFDVEVDDPAEHVMHEERYAIPDEAAATIEAARRGGGAVWAVGTTTVRTLESAVDANGEIGAGSGETRIFIRPPYQFRAVDHLITNFHLPRSTLIMLVAAFAGYDLTMRAYHEAIANRYRFYSYGDAMVVI